METRIRPKKEREIVMRCDTSCNICCGAGGSIACLALLAWLVLPGVVTAFGAQLASLDPILIAVIVIALGLVSGGLWLGAKTHGRGEPFMVSLVGSAATIIGLVASPVVAVLGLLTVGGAIAWNHLVTVRQRRLESLS